MANFFKKKDDGASPLLDLAEDAGLDLTEISYTKFVEKVDQKVRKGLDDVENNCGPLPIPRPNCFGTEDLEAENALTKESWLSKLGRDFKFDHIGDYYGICKVYDVNGTTYAFVSDYSGRLVSYDENGKMVAEYRGLEDELDDLEVDEDNKRIVATSGESCFVWDIDSGRTLIQLSGHLNTIENVEFSQCGKYIVTCSSDQTAKVWKNNVDSQIELMHTLKGHASAVGNCCFSPDSKFLVTLSDDDMALVWDPETGKCLGSLEVNAAQVDCAFSEDSKRVLVCHNNGGILFNLTKHEGPADFLPSVDNAPFRPGAGSKEKLEKIKKFKAIDDLDDFGGISVVMACPGKNANAVLVCDGEDGGTDSGGVSALFSLVNTDQILKFDTKNYDTGYQQGVRSASFSMEGKRVILIRNDRTAVVHDMSNGAPIRRLVMNGGLATAAFTHKGAAIMAFSRDGQGQVRYVYGSTRTGVFRPELEGAMSRVACLTNADYVVCNTEAEIHCANGHTAETIASLTAASATGEGGYFSGMIEVCRDRVVVASARFDSDSSNYVVELLMVDPLKCNILARYTATSECYECRNLKASPDLTKFVASFDDDSFATFDVSSGNNLKLIGTGKNDKIGYATAMRISANNKTFLVGDWRGGVALFTLNGCKFQRFWDQHGDSVTSLAFTTIKGKESFVSVSNDGTMFVADVAGTQKEVSKPKEGLGHVGRISDVTVVETGGVVHGVTTGEDDKRAFVWNLETMERLHILKHLGSVFKVKNMETTPNLVMTATKNRLIRVWDVTTGEQVSFSCCWTFEAEILDISIEPLGHHCAVACSDNTVHLMSLSRLEAQPSAEEVQYLAMMDVEPAVDDAQRLGKTWPEAVCDNHGDGWTVMHQLTNKGREEPLKVLSLTRFAHYTLSLPSRKKLLQLAVDERQKGCVDIILASMKEADPENRIAGDVWPRLCAEYPSVTADFLKHVMEPSNKEVSINVSKYPMKAGDMVTAGSSISAPWPEDWNSESYWDEKTSKVNFNQATVPVKAYFVGVPKLGGFYEDITTSPLFALVESGNSEALGTPAMVAVLTHKWNSFARKRFLISMGLYVVYLLTFSWFARRVHGNLCITCKGSLLEPAVYVAVYLTVASGFYLFAELQELVSHPISYWKSQWNCMEITSYTLAIIYIVFTVAGNPSAGRGIGAVTMVLLWMKMLAFARGFSGTGSFVKMLFTVLKDILFFMSILTIVTIGFTLAFYLLLFDVEPSVGYGSFGSSLFQIYQIMLGNFDTSIYQGTEYEGLCNMLFIVFEFLVTIILLNLLIAVLSDSYAAVQQNAMNEWRLEQAKIIVEIESNLSTRVRRKNKEWFPEWIQVLAPSTDDMVKDENEGLENQLKLRMEHLEKNVAGKIAEMEKVVSEKMADGVQSILDAVLAKSKSKLRKQQKKAKAATMAAAEDEEDSD